MPKPTKLYSYKEFINVPLQIIHAKYAPDDITLLRLYQRINKSGMSIDNALNEPLGNSRDKKPKHRKILELQYKALCRQRACKNPVAVTTYMDRLRKGEDQQTAIIKKRSQYANIKLKVTNTPEIEKALETLRAEEIKLNHKSFTYDEIKSAEEDKWLYNLFKVPKSITHNTRTLHAKIH